MDEDVKNRVIAAGDQTWLIGAVERRAKRLARLYLAALTRARDRRAKAAAWAIRDRQDGLKIIVMFSFLTVGAAVNAYNANIAGDKLTASIWMVGVPAIGAHVPRALYRLRRARRLLGDGGAAPR